MVLRFFFFESSRLNFILYFSATTLVLLLGPEKFIPGLKKSKESPQIDAPCGLMTGVITTSRKGRLIDSYRGIPYAKPPVGPLRFGRPEPFEDPAWEGVFEAKSKKPACFQMHTMIPIIGDRGQEDCLILNVYRPASIEKGVNLPVMVWFHGGGFVTGSSDSNLYGPGNLLDRDVILVTANYRLGVLGFLTLGKSGEDYDIQGNQGLWDQIEVLKWVRKNIRSFGGDPKKVTIFGESAGGMSVSYHLLSKASRGLFQAAIVQSGPIYAPFVKGDYNRPLHEIHTEYAAAIGCPIENGNIGAAAKCLRSKTPEELSSKMFLYDQCNLHDPETMPFPAVWSHSDDSLYAARPFFAANPYQVMKSGTLANVPIMLGFTKEDGLLITATLLKIPQLFQELKDNWALCGPSNVLGSHYGKISPASIDLSRTVRDFYLGAKKDGEISLDADFKNLTYMFTDAAFGLGTDMMVRDLSANGRNNVFYYTFEHQGSFSTGDIFKSTTLEMIGITLGQLVGYRSSAKLGVCHADDIFYLFNSDLPFSFLSGEEDDRMIDAIVDLWTNFATFHDPTPSLELKEYLDTNLVSGDSFRQMKWPSVEAKSTKSPVYARLKNGQVLTEKDPSLEKRMDFLHRNVVQHLFKF